MDLNTAKEFVERYPGYISYTDTKTHILSASNLVTKEFGYKSIEQIKNKSYYEFPVKISKLAKFFEWSEKDIISGEPYILELSSFCTKHNKKALTICQKFPIKNKNCEVIGIIASCTDITQYNLIDIARYLKLSEHDKCVVKNCSQFFYKIHKENNNNQYYLSTRELECLFYLLRGYSAKSIGKILCLSYRTVESYIENIKYKFNCPSKSSLIEKAIMESDLGLNPNTAGNIIRINLPALTEERRRELTKVVHTEGEHGKVAVRNVRRDAIHHIKDLLKDKDISEDDERRAETSIQQITDRFVDQIDEIVKIKDEELMEI